MTRGKNNRFSKRNRNVKRRGGARGRFSTINTPRNTNIELGATTSVAKRQLRPTIIPKMRFAPDSVIVDLTYPDTVYQKNNVGAGFISWRYRMNSIWDPDPLIGSGSVPGWAFWGGGYNSYRVLQCSYSIDISNLEGSPVDVVCCPSQTDLGANYSATNELFGNPYATQALLSAKGGMDRARLKGIVDLGKFSGNVAQYLGNDSFGSGNFSNNPGAILYLNIGGVSSTLFTTNNGLDYRVTLTYTTLLTGRKTVTT